MGGPLISDAVAPLLSAMWYDVDKTAGISKLRTAIRDWDADRRAEAAAATATAAAAATATAATAAAKAKKAVPAGPAPPDLSRRSFPAPAQPVKTSHKRVDFAKASRPTDPKGKAKAVSPPPSDEDRNYKRPVAVGPPGKSRTTIVSEKRARESSDEEGEDSVPRKAAAPPAKKKRIVSDKFIEDSDEGEDSAEVGGENPYPCARCIERKVVCEWLLDTGKKTCKVCARAKARCSTMHENKEALRAKRRAVEKATKKALAETEEIRGQPSTSVTVKRAAPRPVPSVAKAVETEVNAKVESWTKKFQGKSKFSRCRTLVLIGRRDDQPSGEAREGGGVSGEVVEHQAQRIFGNVRPA